MHAWSGSPQREAVLRCEVPEAENRTEELLPSLEPLTMADIRVCRDTRFFIVMRCRSFNTGRTGLFRISACCQSQGMIQGPAEVSAVAEDALVKLGSEHGACKAFFQVRQNKGDSLFLQCNGKVLDSSAARDVTAVH